MDSAEQDRTIRHGGGVKLLLRCLQSIQCQYYLVFGVVKIVPLQSFARLRAFPIPFLHPFHRRSPRNTIAAFLSSATQTAQHMANGHTYILHLLSLRSSLIIYIACARTFHPSPSFDPSFLAFSITENLISLLQVELSFSQ